MVGHSGSGKTLVVTRAVRTLRSRGLTVAVVKHSHHDPDLRGKDSDRFYRAGADLVLFASRSSFLRIRSPVDALVRVLPVDVVLVEGFHRRTFGGLRLHVDRPGEVAHRVREAVGFAPRRPHRVSLMVNGRRVGADALWRLVANVMASRGTRAVGLES